MRDTNRNNNNNNSNSNNRNTTNGATTTTTTTTTPAMANGPPSTSIATLSTGIPPGLTITTSSGNNMQSATGEGLGESNSTAQNLLHSAISLPQGVTIHVSTGGMHREEGTSTPNLITCLHFIAGTNCR